MKKTIDRNTDGSLRGTVTFTFDPIIGADGTKMPLEAVVFSANAVSNSCKEHAMLHGFSARIGDAAALSKDATNGYRVTEEMRRKEVLAMVAHYESGTSDWNMRAAGPRAASLNPTILAIAQKMNCTYEEAMAKVAATFLSEIEGE